MRNASGEEKYTYKSRIIAVVEQDVEVEEGKIKTFEKARRSPGVRIIVRKGDSFLITREYRHELNNYDYRLAGGKVFDNLEEYLESIANSEDIIGHAKQAISREAAEELGISVKSSSLFHESKCGATVDWTLFYFVVDDFVENGMQKLEAGETIEPIWLAADKLKQMCLDGSVDEERSALVLLRLIS